MGFPYRARFPAQAATSTATVVVTTSVARSEKRRRLAERFDELTHGSSSQSGS
jgi:hypothetical protein